MIGGARSVQVGTGWSDPGAWDQGSGAVQTRRVPPPSTSSRRSTIPLSRRDVAVGPRKPVRGPGAPMAIPLSMMRTTSVSSTETVTSAPWVGGSDGVVYGCTPRGPPLRGRS